MFLYILTRLFNFSFFVLDLVCYVGQWPLQRDALYVLLSLINITVFVSVNSVLVWSLTGAISSLICRDAPKLKFLAEAEQNETLKAE